MITSPLHRRRTACTGILVATWFGAAGTSMAADNAQTAEEMQRALNQQVMATPFNPGDIKKAQAYAEDAKKQGVVPVAAAPSYWMPGWTCANLAGYRYYNYGDYQNCYYHHYYYGRYWP